VMDEIEMMSALKACKYDDEDKRESVEVFGRGVPKGY